MDYKMDRYCCPANGFFTPHSPRRPNCKSSEVVPEVKDRSQLLRKSRKELNSRGQYKDDARGNLYMPCIGNRARRSDDLVARHLAPQFQGGRKTVPEGGGAVERQSDRTASTQRFEKHKFREDPDGRECRHSVEEWHQYVYTHRHSALKRSEVAGMLKLTCSLREVRLPLTAPFQTYLTATVHLDRV